MFLFLTADVFLVVSVKKKPRRTQQGNDKQSQLFI